MSIGVIFFHANLLNLYPRKWIDDCCNSIYHQNYKNFKVFELNYGEGGDFFYPGEAVRHQIKLNNHSEAQNYILNRAFQECEVVFNTNMDDIYREDRFEKQLPFMSDFDIVSCDMHHIDEGNKIIRTHFLSHMNLEENFTKEHNIIAHPACCYSRRFWTNKKNPGFQFSNFPRDDFELWKWAKKQGFRFKIVPETLLYYRVHSQQVSKPDNAKRLKQIL